MRRDAGRFNEQRNDGAGGLTSVTEGVRGLALRFTSPSLSAPDIVPVLLRHITGSQSRHPDLLGVRGPSPRAGGDIRAWASEGAAQKELPPECTTQRLTGATVSVGTRPSWAP